MFLRRPLKAEPSCALGYDSPPEGRVKPTLCMVSDSNRQPADALLTPASAYAHKGAR